MLPSEEEIQPIQMIRACTLQLQSITLHADFIVIPMVTFDVILSMDWLSKYRAVIDCKEKTSNLRQKEVRWHSQVQVCNSQFLSYQL